MPESVRSLLTRALQLDDVPTIESLIREHPDLLNAPNERPPVATARTAATAERLLSLGADLDVAGKWWAPGFDTRSVATDVGRLLAERGAPVTIHAAAGLGLIDRLAEMLDADSSLVHAKGGDGCTPLHFARDVATAAVLLNRGARIDARDDDHESTPAQWLIGDAPDVARFLLERGATPDIFLAAALGDRALAEKLISVNPAYPSHRIGKLPEFPPIGHKGRGGTIYQWTLAFNSYPHQIALRKGHPELFDFLYEKSDTATRLLVSCVLARRPEAETIALQNPGLVASLPPEDHELVARYCWETNTNYDAVKLMLDVGLPVAHPERSHGYSPLHNAAWSGSADLVDLLIQRGHPVDIADPTYKATPLGFAIYDCTVAKRHPEGEFGRVTKSLIEGGCPWDPLDYPVGDARIDEVLQAHMRERADGAAMLGDEPVMKALLGENPSPDELTKALAGAAKGRHFEICRNLLAAGAPVNGSIGPHGITPLACAIGSGSQEMIELLLSSGADVHARSAHGSTALLVAITRGASVEIIDLLLRSGAGSQIEIANEFGNTPVQIATERGRQDVLQLLRGPQAS